MKNSPVAPLGALLALVFGGCSTCITTNQAWPAPDFFAGVSTDVELVSERDESVHGEPRGLTLAFAVIDFPFSLVADTLLIPVNLVLLARRENHRTSKTGDKGQPHQSEGSESGSSQPDGAG
jgi:uncharacterized protein YceK